MIDTKEAILHDAIECAIRAEKLARYYRNMLFMAWVLNAGLIIASVILLIER